MTNVTIKFKVPECTYNQYEDIIQDFLNYLNDICINDIEVIER